MPGFFIVVVERTNGVLRGKNPLVTPRVTPSPVGVMIQTTPIIMERFYLIALQSSANEDFPERSFFK
jgi:hypothetical protein